MNPLILTIWNSSCRVYAKCSQRLLLTFLPAAARWALSRSVTRGTQPPQPVPALVHVLTAPRVVSPWSRMAWQICPLVTLLQEQTWAPSARRVTPLPAAWPSPLAKQQLAGGDRQGVGALGVHQERAVVGGVADQDAAQEPGPVAVEDQLFVHSLKRVLERDAPRLGRVREVLAEAGDVHTHQLELGGQVGAGEGAVGAGEVGRQGVRHLVTGRHQPVDHAPVQRDLADGEDVGVAGAQRVIDDHAAARADLEPAGPGQLVAGLDPRRDDHHVHVEPTAVGELHPLHLAVAEDRLGVLVQVDLDPKALDLAGQQPASRRHRPGAA